jgi:NTP pyrophosphatase (non-canonical NTP hydrolase)
MAKKKAVSEPVELNIFRKGGSTYDGLLKAQAFFDEHVHNVESIDRAFLWMTEELGEAARIIRREEVTRYKDAIGDLTMWVITLSRLLGIEVADALEYSVRQLVAKGYSDLDPSGVEIDVQSE